MPLEKRPEGGAPAARSDMGRRSRRRAYASAPLGGGIVQSMPGKGNRVGSAPAEQVLGHMKDGFFRGRGRGGFESLGADLAAHVARWNTKRRQVKLNGPAPKEFRRRRLPAA